MKIILSFVLSLFGSMLYAGPIDWSVAMTSFPSDQSVGDTGQEKTPNGYVDLMSGNLVYDVPEVTLKGERGLNFTLSRSYGKVNNGFRSMGNWELESPRLVMMTGPSTKLQGDSGAGICEANGDATNNSSGRPSYYATLLDTGFKNQIEQTYVNQANVTLANQTLVSIINIIQYLGAPDSNSTYNKEKANAALNSLRSQLYAAFQSNTNAISFSKDQAANQKRSYAQALQSLMVYNIKVNGKQLVIGIDQDRNGVNDGISSVLDNIRVTDNIDVTVNPVFSNYPGTIQTLTLTARQTIIGYLYFYNIEKIKNTPAYDLYSKNSLSPYTDVDDRKRLINLYLPGQKNITFYPVKSGVVGYPQSAKYISQDNWYISCTNSGKDFVVRSNNGVIYHFPSENRENQTGFTSLFGNQYIPGRVSIYASKIENQFNEAYQLNYFNKKTNVLVYAGFNYTNKFFLKSVQHTLDGKTVNQNSPELILNYAKQWGENEALDEDKFDKLNGEITLKKIMRYINGGYKEWISYNYTNARLFSNYKLNDLILGGTKTIDDYQNDNSAFIYLQAVGYITGDAITYTYKGPYRIVRNAAPAGTEGMVSTDFLWFYSDLTGTHYYKNSSNGLVNTKSVYWTYSLINESRPGFAENKSYKVTSSL